MEIKQKKCKGIGKAIGVTGCGNLSRYRKFGLCPDCLHDFLFETDAGKLVYQKTLIQAAKKVKTEKRKEDNEKRDSLKSLTQVRTDAKKAIQKCVTQVMDNGKPCISCGKHCNDPCGGHYFKAELYNGVVLDERNINLQCNAHCNMYLSGNEINYRIGLVKRYGEDWVKQLEKDAIETKNKKWTRQELIEEKEYYQKLIKESKC